MFALLLLLLGSCFLVARTAMGAGEKEFSPAIESYLAKANTGEYHRAYAEFGKEMHEAVTEEDYVSLDTGMHEKLGVLRSKKLQSVQAGADLKGTWGRVVYECDFEHGKGTIAIGLREEGRVWKIINVRYDSPIFMDSFRSKARQQP